MIAALPVGSIKQSFTVSYSTQLRMAYSDGGYNSLSPNEFNSCPSDTLIHGESPIDYGEGLAQLSREDILSIVKELLDDYIEN